MVSLNRKKQSTKPPARKNLIIAIFLACVVFLSFKISSNPNSNGNSGVYEGLQLGPSTSKAQDASYGLFDDVTDLMWERLWKKYRSTSLYKNPDKPLKGVEEEEKWLSNNPKPNFACPHIDRIGKGEGVKYICYPDRVVRKKDEPARIKFDKKGDAESPCLVYSIGCAGDFSFEYALADKYNNECEIHIFDPANWERKEDKEKKNIHYHAWGMKSTYDLTSKSVVWPKGQGGGFKTFQDTLEELGHSDRTIDLFKIDCEGCEWSNYKDWIGFGFRQILMEIHGVPQPNGGKGRWYQKPMNITDFFQDFDDHGYALFSTDQNGLGMELSYVKLEK
eukprot:201125_1